MAYSHRQMCTSTVNRCRLAPTFSSSGSQSISSKHTASGKAILPSDGQRAYCSSPLLLESAVENNVTIIRLPDQCTHTLVPLDNCLFGPLKSFNQK
jgi:hypothetical protein